MQFLLQNKLALGVAAAVVILIGAYFVIGGGKEEGALLESTQQSNDLGSPVSRELLLTLSALRVVTLDESLFADPSFRSLVDFGVEIPLQPVGRRNPFAPFSASQTIRTSVASTTR
jgi:hypothetical protein